MEPDHLSTEIHITAGQNIFDPWSVIYTDICVDSFFYFVIFEKIIDLYYMTDIALFNQTAASHVFA